MPITFTLPFGQTEIGPASRPTATSSVADPGVGPFIWEWIVEYSNDVLFFYSTIRNSANGRSNVIRILYNEDDTPNLLTSANSVDLGVPIRLRVQLRNDAGQIVDTGTSTGLKWNPTTQIHEDLLLTDTTVTGGFTAEDRAQAQITQMGVTLPLPGLSAAGEIASGLTGFFTNPPSWAQQLLEGVVLEGIGTVTRPGAGRQVNAYGAQLDFLAVPDGLGAVLGNPAVYSERIVQLSIVREGLANRQYYDGINQLYADHQRIMWGTPFPVRLDYAVIPGASVLLTWLHLAPDWWPF